MPICRPVAPRPTLRCNARQAAQADESVHRERQQALAREQERDRAEALHAPSSQPSSRARCDAVDRRSDTDQAITSVDGRDAYA